MNCVLSLLVALSSANLLVWDRYQPSTELYGPPCRAFHTMTTGTFHVVGKSRSGGIQGNATCSKALLFGGATIDAQGFLFNFFNDTWLMVLEVCYVFEMRH